MPASPIQPLLGETIWQDFRDNDNIISYQQKTRASKVNNNLDLVEASGWVVDNKGEVELVTDKRLPNPQRNWYSAPNCR